MAIGLDPGWLAQALADAQGAQAPRSVSFDGFIGTGQMSRNARFGVDWGTVSGPESVVVKVPSDVEGTVSVAFDHRLYLKECDFYRTLSSRVDVAVPRALAVHFDPEGRDFAIVLEDLAGSEPGDQFVALSRERIELAIAAAAALHAPVWGDVDDPEFGELHADFEARGETSKLLLELMLPAVLDRLGDGLERDVVELLERLAEMSAEWSERIRQPVTMFHGDFRPDNLLFGRATGAPDLAVVDWQTLSLGLGVTDVAYLIGGALEPNIRREVEADLVELYRAELAGRGVDYPADRCGEEYALSSLHGVVIGLAATVMADQTDRGDALFTLMLNRHGRHAIDLAALDRL